jgi:hypothetical protein
MLALLHRLFQSFLATAKAGVYLVVRFVADSVNLRNRHLEWDVQWN